MHQGGGGRDLLRGRRGAAVGDVFRHGGGFHGTVLEDDRHGAVEPAQGQGADILPVQEDGAGIRLIEAQEQVDERGFAHAGGAYHGHGFPGTDDQGQVLQDVFAADIGEGQVIEGDFPFDLRIGVRGLSSWRA